MKVFKNIYIYSFFILIFCSTGVPIYLMSIIHIPLNVAIIFDLLGIIIGAFGMPIAVNKAKNLRNLV